MKGYILFSVFFVFILTLSCRKDSFITSSSAVIATSDDSLAFDTIFTSTGSITHYFKIFNRNDQKLKLSNISLAGGQDSYFTFNADGFEGPQVSDLEIRANDSIYVFVTVRIDPSQEDLPFIIGDSIRINFNGNEHWVKLSAWGQNAHFLHSRVIVQDTSWTNEKPIVITGGLLVAEGATLNIQKGSRIYLHADAPMVVDGTLQAAGEHYDSTKIIFQGDRLDKYYRDLPGGWPGIYFRESSKSNLLKHVVVKNAYQGLVTEKPSGGAFPKLYLDAVEVSNCYDAGIIASNSSVRAVNTLIANCGKNVVLIFGGEYEFVHCTDVAVSNNFIPHKEPVLLLTDFIKTGEVVNAAPVKARFTNCIFWGNNGTVDDEVVVLRQGAEAFDVTFTNCLWKVVTPPSAVSVSGIIENADPLFTLIESSRQEYDFRLKEGSPAVNSGNSVGTSTDLDGNNRANIPDIGAYETIF